MKIIITTEDQEGVKWIETYTDLDKALIKYRNLKTEKANGRYKGILKIELAHITNNPAKGK